ncbi:MAG TPA: MarR family transcriptional regulator [Dehalococcoidia bacterium]|nr:MarR family transcriptional regulator [Dehalococcoidia bacterium]
MSERALFEDLLDVLDQVLTKAGSIHSAAYDFGTGVPLYKTEIHTIRAIGENQGINVTQLAELMGVTKGAESQTIKKLVRKKLVEKTPAHDNAREILLGLTDLGWTGFYNHEQFHMEMYDTLSDYFGNELKSKLETFIAVMSELNKILDAYQRRSNYV